MGCGTSALRHRAQPDAAGADASARAEAAVTQRLFRIQYSGSDGSGGLRLVLRWLGDSHFQLATADTLGRSLWALEVRRDVTLFIDHREEVFCRGDESLRLREPTLAMFPLTALPRILRGDLPVEWAEPYTDEGSTEFVEGGYRWSIRRDDAGLAAWTLWMDDSPTLWWTRQDKGGILSHRDGSQFRWRVIVSETAGHDLPPLEAPQGFREISCHAYDLPKLREDQSSSRGDRPSR